MSVERRDEANHLPHWLLIGLLLVAFGLWVYHLDGQSLWRDEGLSLGRAHQPLSLIFANRNLVQGVSSQDLHPPLYFLMLRGWIALAGESEFALRFPSVLAMVFAVVLMAALGRRVWGAASGGTAAALAVLSPFYLWYAQEARMYAWVVLESLILLATLWPLLKKQAGWWPIIRFGLAALFLAYTHYSGLFLVGFALLAYVAVRLERKSWRRFLLILAVMGLAAIPLWPSIRDLLAAPGFLNFSPRSLWTLWQEVVRTFSLGSAAPDVNIGWRWLPFVLLFLLGCLSLDVKPSSQRWLATLVGPWGFMITLFLFYLASWLQANYSNPRHLIVLSPFWFLLMGHGVVSLWRRFKPAAVLVGGATIVLGGAVLLQTIVDPPMVRDDVRSLATFIKERARPGDAVLWHDAVMMNTYEYYATDLPYTAIPRYGLGDWEQVGPALEEWVAGKNRIWFVSPPAPSYIDKALVPDWIDDRMVRVLASSFPASWTTLQVQLYRPPADLEALPAGAFPLDIQQGDYALHGIAPESDVVAGKGVWVSLFWSLDGDAPADRPTACVRLLDSAATIWSENCASLVSPHPVSLQVQQIWLPLPLGLAPIRYDVELTLEDSVYPAGSLDVRRPVEAASSPAAVSYTGGLELVEIDWMADEFRAGLWAIGDLLWRAAEPLEGDWTVTMKVLDWRGRTIAEVDDALGPPDYEPQAWQPGELVRDRLAVRLPFDLRGLYRVQIEVKNAAGESLQAQDGFLTRLTDQRWVRVQGWPLEKELPSTVEHRLDTVTVGSNIQLLGYDVARVGHTLTVDLYWQSDATLADDYGVFVHVARPGEAPLLQSSGGPANWLRPVSTWRPDEVILDSHVIELPPDLDPAGLSVLVGMYEPSDPNVRLPVRVDGREVTDRALNLGDLP